MESIEILGFFGGACLIAAMLLRKIYIVKVLMLLTAISFVIYGLYLDLLAIIVLNIVLFVSGIYEIVRLSMKRKKAASQLTSDGG